MQCFLDTEFTSLLAPRLLSVGLVTLDGRECYAELDLSSEFGRKRLAITPQDVQEGILDKFKLFPDSVCDSEWSLGLRVWEWLLGVAESDSSGRVELLYDYPVDFALLVGAFEECNLWRRVRLAASEAGIGSKTGTIGPELASEGAFRTLSQRTPPLYRHHALADALALRAAWRTWHLVHERTGDLRRLLDAATLGREGWLYEWLASPALALGGRVPLDVLDEAAGVQLVVDALVRIGHGRA